MKFVALLGLGCLLAPGLMAQHRGGGGFSSSGFIGHPGGFTGIHGTFSNGFHHSRFNTPYYGYGYGYGYWPLWDYYGDWNGAAYPSNAGMGYSSQPNVTVIYPPPAPPVMVAEVAHPVIHEYKEMEDYGLPSEHENRAELSTAEGHSPLSLIAFKSGVIRAAMAYWVTADTIHYLDTDHKEQKAPLATVDRDLSLQLNRERHVPFNL